MAEPTISLNYASLHGQVLSRFPALTDAAGAKAVVDRAYLAFLRAHPWSFLRPVTTLSVTAEDATTALPDNFAYMVGDFRYAAGSGRLGMTMAGSEEIQDRLAGSNVTGYPTHYAIEPAAFVAATGQRWQVRWYPVPSENLTLSYQYQLAPAKMTADAEYPMGGAYDSLTILYMAFAEAERAVGNQSGVYVADRDRYLAESIRLDGLRSAGELSLDPPRILYTSGGLTEVSA